MQYQRIHPPKSIEKFVDCFWTAESDGHAISKQKIIPDGFPELIFHYGAPFKINFAGRWALQEKSLVAGQIKQHFLLENTGAAGVFGIKFKPTALTHLFNITMRPLAGKVVSLASLNVSSLNAFEIGFQKSANTPARIDFSVREIEALVCNLNQDAAIIDKAIALIFAANGGAPISEICKRVFISERQLQRLFQKYIGLSPKLYSRIIRFNFIFTLLKAKKVSWTDITYHSGYFDQSHFIRDFKAFSGEDPSKYFFGDDSMANFFLKK